jgi:uncharacterized protein with PQ loop repeat
MYIEAIALAAGGLSVCKAIPQAHKTFVENEVSSFSKQSLMIGLVAALLWVWYGYMKKSPVIILGGVAGFVYDVWVIMKINKFENSKDE